MKEMVHAGTHPLPTLAIVVGALVAVAACTEPVVLEDRPAACLNGKDDDGDGLIDCEDPDCVGTGVCETTATQCENGQDDDRDGKTDCEDEQCAAFCAPVERDCSTSPQSGCTRGLACYPRELTMVGKYCARPGPGRPADGCVDSESCGAGMMCTQGMCHLICQTDDDCERGGFCTRLPNAPAGLCFNPCLPGFSAKPCRGGECVTLHRFLITYHRADAVAICGVAPAWEGTADVGAECDDPPSRGALARMCKTGLSCLPRGDGNGECVALCGLLREAGDGGVETTRTVFECLDPEKKCILAHPLDRRRLGSMGVETGVCVDR
jgi:hypothetical protein